MGVLTTIRKFLVSAMCLSPFLLFGCLIGGKTPSSLIEFGPLIWPRNKQQTQCPRTFIPLHVPNRPKHKTLEKYKVIYL
jgi:hypothetical protein